MLLFSHCNSGKNQPDAIGTIFYIKGKTQFQLFSDKWIDRNVQHKKAFTAFSTLWAILNCP